jgi:hypothetical protein
VNTHPFMQFLYPVDSVCLQRMVGYRLISSANKKEALHLTFNAQASKTRESLMMYIFD